MSKRHFLCLLLACGLWGAGPHTVAAAEVPAPDPLDWPSWRGPEQNGISREVGLVYQWDLKGKNLLWRKPEFGTRSTPIVMRGKLYTLCRSEPETPREGERVVCLDAASGELLWENKFNVFLTDVPCERVGWSCVVGDPETGRIYALGVCGYFQCIDGESGETIWSRSLSEEFGLVSTYGGRTNVPVIFEDLVIISAVMTNWGEHAVPAHRFIAFDKMTGEPRWFNGTRLRPEDTTYSTPFLTVLAGQAAMVFGSSDGAVHAFQPRTGKPIWHYQFSPRGLNVSPVVDRGIVYMGQSEENRDDNTMGAVAAINGELEGDITERGELWRVKELLVGKSSPLVLGDRLYAADDANLLYVLDTRSGEVIARQKLLGTIMRASLLYADGHIFACTTSAWHVLEPTEEGVKIVHRLRFPQEEEIHGSPIVSHGRIYLPTTGALYCIGAANVQPAATARPAPPREDSVDEQPQPAWLQLVPVDSLIRPGEQVQFRVRLFNARGQFLREATPEQVQFSVDQGGQIDAAGRFTADSSAAHVGLTVTAKLGELTGSARVRIVPPLPWHFDFDDAALTPNPMSNLPEGEPPLTWIGARYRHKVRKLDGEQVMVKVTTIPKGTRSQSWMGQADLHDYTIQADMRGAIKDGKLPDMGVIAQRYSLELMGNAQELRIRSWTSQLNRFSKTIPFAWKDGVWYTIKFRASVENGAAVLRGKVWPRGEPEPQAWTIEAVDEAPNVVGSPGLFGNASDAEIYIDNISVIPN